MTPTPPEPLAHNAADNPKGPSPADPTESCSRCRAPCFTEYIPQDSELRYGDICAIHESPSTPVHILTRGRPPRAGTPQSKTNARPGLILGPPTSTSGQLRPPSARSQRLICLLATFGGERDLAQLSEILRFFCVPIYPHHTISACTLTTPHIHTSPEWCDENTWLFVSPFTSHAQITGRWQNRRASGHQLSSYHLDDASMAALIDISEQKRIEWEALLERDPGAAHRMYKEYRADNKRIGNQRRALSRSSTASSPPSLAGRRTRTQGLPELPPLPGIQQAAGQSTPSSPLMPQPPLLTPDAPYSPAGSTSEFGVALGPAPEGSITIPRSGTYDGGLGVSTDALEPGTGLADPAPLGTAPVQAA